MEDLGVFSLNCLEDELEESSYPTIAQFCNFQLQSYFSSKKKAKNFFEQKILRKNIGSLNSKKLDVEKIMNSLREKLPNNFL